ncbi:glucoside xylosyltransferase 2-like isoform X2 [Macrobrachium nipponense]|uniref:glucoside xylosyltransferase 2-like isoform X2 n=1 Tax=Macrobrachium nipponense TaxID=159736 RepID=UPI0030C84C72
MTRFIRVCQTRYVAVIVAAVTLATANYLLWNKSIRHMDVKLDTPARNHIRDSEAGVNKSDVHFVIIACKKGNKVKYPLRENWDHQIRQIKVLLKSAALLTSTVIKFSIVTNSQETYKEITAIADSWPSEYRRRLVFGVRREVYYPPALSRIQDMFCWCCTERLFLPDVLPDVDSVIFVDTDTIFMQPPEDLFQNFGFFDDRQVAGVTPCLYMYDEPWRKRIPSFGFSGLNAGVLLLNLTRLRSFPGGWVPTIKRTIAKYKDAIELADQDILNIIFSGRKAPLAYEVGCEWNYRQKVCSLDRNRCPNAAAKGVALLHGCDTTFVKNNEPKIRAVFEAWEKYDLRSSPGELLSLMEEGLRKVNRSAGGCATLSNIDDILMKGLRRHLVVA